VAAVIDSNTLIYYLNAALPPKARAWVDQELLEGGHISIITRIEVLGWPGHSAAAHDKAGQLLELLTEHALTSAIADLCISLRQTRRIKVPDAVIAATAIFLGLPLVTRNTGDFKGISGLELRNPFDAEGQR
jgi:predicted nucleic acid-binding protein